MRYDRATAVLLKVETTPNTDAVPVNTTDCMLLRKFTFKQEIKYVNVPEIRNYFGGGLDLVGSTFISGTFESSLAGSGAAGTAPPWNRFMRSAAFAETISAGSRVEYSPISTALESSTLYYYDDGVLKKALGLRFNITSFKMGYGDVPIIAGNYIALDGGLATAANVVETLTAWKAPLPINTANSGLLTIGGTYSAGVISGGVTYPSKGIELALGGQMNFMELLGGESAEFTDRNMSGKITLDLTAAQEVAFMATVKAGTTQSIGLAHGAVAGYKLLSWCPNAQLKNPVSETLNGKRLLSYDINPVPTPGTGNDEWKLVAL